MIRTYHELILLPSFEDRFEYLAIKQLVGEQTFGSHRNLNQMLYRNPKWKSIRRQVIIRDEALDLAHKDFPLMDRPAYVHHINPITIDDILKEKSCVFDLNNLITCSFNTHQAIHYGAIDMLPKLPIERTPNDTCPWRKH